VCFLPVVSQRSLKICLTLWYCSSLLIPLIRNPCTSNDPEALCSLRPRLHNSSMYSPSHHMPMRKRLKHAYLGCTHNSDTLEILPAAVLRRQIRFRQESGHRRILCRPWLCSLSASRALQVWAMRVCLCTRKLFARRQRRQMSRCKRTKWFV